MDAKGMNPMKLTKRNRIMALAVVACSAFYAGRGSVPAQPSRPVLSFLAKAARAGLWLLFLGDQQEQQPTVVQHRIGDDGYEVLDHSRSL
jgi:hypothetical protein